MTRNEILQTTHANFDEFRALWLDHVRDKGLGALVFSLDEVSGDEDEIQCEYWTLSELRDYVRRMQECDEVVYTWLKNAEHAGGYPIVIFSRGSEPDCEQLHFSSVGKPQAA